MALLNRILPLIIFVTAVVLIVFTYITNYSVTPNAEGPSTDLGMTAVYIFGGLAIIGIIADFALTAVTDAQSIIRYLIMFVIILIVWGISHSMAGNEVTKVYENFDVDAALSKFIGGVLILTYSLGILIFLGVIFTEVSSAFKS